MTSPSDTRHAFEHLNNLASARAVHAAASECDSEPPASSSTTSCVNRAASSLPFAGSLVESRLLGSSLAKTQQRPSSKDSKCGRKSLSKRPSKRPNNQPSKEGARRGRSEVRARAAAQGVQQPKMVAAIQSDITSAVPWAPVTALCTQQSQRSAVSTASRPRLLHTVQWSRASPGVL